MNNLLFIYGTLLDEDNEYAAYLKNNSVFYAAGKIKGMLYDIGEYPGVVLNQEGVYIHGNIIQINEPEKVFSVIVDYEGYGNDQPNPNEFIRVVTEVETEAGLVNCWIYVYNLSCPGLKLIESGRYKK